MFALVILLKHLLPDTAFATFTYILVSYHLILAFKVFTADKKAAMSLPLGQTILTHLACVGVLVSFAVLRHQIPFFGLIRYFLPGLAPFEAEWLFSSEKVKIERLNNDEAIQAATVRFDFAPDAPVTTPPAANAVAAPVAAAPAVSLYDSSTGDDYNDFLTTLQQGKRPFRKPGISVKEEYELWLAHRAKTLAGGPAKQPSALGRFLQVGRNVD